MCVLPKLKDDGVSKGISCEYQGGNSGHYTRLAQIHPSVMLGGGSMSMQMAKLDM